MKRSELLSPHSDAPIFSEVVPASTSSGPLPGRIGWIGETSNVHDATASGLRTLGNISEGSTSLHYDSQLNSNKNAPPTSPRGIIWDGSPVSGQLQTRNTPGQPPSHSRQESYFVLQSASQLGKRSTATSHPNSVDRLRFSPSIIARQPMPLLRLPTLPPLNPVPQARVNTQARLRNMPALPRKWPQGDSAESFEEEGEEDEEDSDDDVPRTSPGGDEEEGYTDVESEETSYDLPDDVSRPDLSFPDSTPGKGKEPQNAPIPSRSSDYFSTRYPTRRSSVSTPTLSKISPMPEKPVIYQHISRSMIDLASGKQDQPASAAGGAIPRSHSYGKGKTDEASEMGPTAMKDVLPTTRSPLALPVAPWPRWEDSMDQPLSRRRSMPNLNTLPPPYPHPVVTRLRYDDGHERLPQYSNSIYLKAVMSCKMEYSAPGIQAKDRKWRRLLCVLEGTMFKLYDCPAKLLGVGALGFWWERKVGVGDTSMPLPVLLNSESAEEETERMSKLDLEDVPNVHRLESRSHGEVQPPPTPESVSRLKWLHLLRAPSSHSRSRSEAHMPTSAQQSATSLNIERSASSNAGRSLRSDPSRSTNWSTATTTLASTYSSSSMSQSRFTVNPQSSGADISTENMLPVRTYTLQNAECGLGTDYAKRKYVIRVRAEGEQFLLQAHNVPSVVEWIEGFQAAINIALDLDERIMPKPVAEKRRRRRPRSPTSQGFEKYAQAQAMASSP